MKLENIKNALATLLFEIEKVAFEKTVTDKGVIGYEGEFEVGAKVFLVNENDEQLPIEDGEYITEEGKTIVVAEGVITEIKEKEEPTEEPTEEPKEEPTEEVKAETEEPKEEIVEPTEEPKEEETKEEDTKIMETLEAMVKSYDELKARVEKMEEVIKSLEGASLTKTVEEEFEAIKKVDNTPLKGKEKAKKYMQLR